MVVFGLEVGALRLRAVVIAAHATLRAHAQSLLVRPCDASDGFELPLRELRRRSGQ